MVEIEIEEPTEPVVEVEVETEMPEEVAIEVEKPTMTRPKPKEDDRSSVAFLLRASPCKGIPQRPKALVISIRNSRANGYIIFKIT